MSDESMFFAADNAEGARWFTADDPIRGAVTEILYEIEADLDKIGWDLPPVMFWLYRHGPVQVGEGEAFAFHISQVPVPTALWEKAEPVRVLEFLCDTIEAMRAATGITAGDELMGYVFAVEAWLVKPRSRAEQRKAEKEARKRRLDVHPDRIETRLLTAVDSAGEKYVLAHERDSIITEMSAEDARQVTGGVPDALSRLLELSRG